MTGDRAGAVAAYGQVRDIDDKDRPYEAYNYRWAQERLRAPMSQADRLLLIAGNDMGQKRYGNALRLFKEALTKPDSGIDISIRALYGLQQLYFECDSLVRAVDISRQLLALTPTREIWIVPHAYFRLGQIYAKMGQTEDARRSFEMVNDFDDYDFQNGLERRTEQELHKLKTKSGT
jgi:tetratricopeptide (TPR) repeat protein